MAIVGAAQPSLQPTGTRAASLAVSATVVRPAEISPLITPEGTIIVIRNAERVTVSVDQGVVRQADPRTAIVEIDGRAASVITLTY